MPFHAIRRPLISSACLLSGASLLVSCSGKSEAPATHDAEAVQAATARVAERFSIVGGERVPAPSIPMGDERTIQAILDEGQNRNQVMDHLVYLTSNFGARLTASSALEGANRWSADLFEGWGLSNVELSQWDEAQLRFDRGPSSGVAYLAGDAETDRTFEFSTLAWTKGTDGAARGPVVKMPHNTEGFDPTSVSGAWVLLPPEPLGRRGIRGVTGQLAARSRLREDVREAIAQGPGLVTEDTFDHIAEIGGVWNGTFGGPGIPEGAQPFALEMSITASGKPNFEAGMPDASMGPIEAWSLEGDALSFTSRTPRGVVTYALTRDGSAMTGTAQFNGFEYRVELNHTEPLSEAAADNWREWRLLRHVLEAGPLGFISSAQDERVWTSSPVRGLDLLEVTIDDVAHDIEISVRGSDYDYLNSKLADATQVDVEFNLPHTLTPGPIPLYNTIAEIRGTEFPDEVVIVSAHLDSWNGPGSTGTVDNGTGSAVTLEAARILAAVGAQPKRTIRFILWTGEEQGLMGSRAYVDALTEEERSKISAVFVDDGGTNSEGGLPAADFMVDYLAAATAPTNGVFTSAEHAEWALTDDNEWNDDGYINVNVRPTGETIQTHSGSDHAPFNAVGIPGFFWDEVGRAQYWEAWHTQNDTIDQAVPEYLQQSATNAAITAYNLACAPGLLPREGEASAAETDTDSIETQIGTRE